MDKMTFSPEDAFKEHQKMESKSLDIMKDHYNRQEKLSKELRDWFTSVATISATVISIIIAFRGNCIKQDYFLIAALFILIVVIVISLFHRMNIVNKMCEELFKYHAKIQERIEDINKLYEIYVQKPSEDNLNSILEYWKKPPDIEKIDEIKSDRYLWVVIYLFILALIFLFVSILV